MPPINKNESNTSRLIIQWINRAINYVGQLREIQMEHEKWRLIGHDGETPGGIPIKTDIDDVLRAAKVAKSNDYNDLDNLPCQSGIIAPTTIPTRIGNQFIDTVHKKIYVATGITSPDDWTPVN